MDARRRLSDLLDGPLPALPRPLDRGAEAWAGARPRTRAALGTLAALVVLAVAGSGAARSPWGAARDVLVATTDLPAGRTLTADVVRSERWPAEVGPADALPVDGTAVGATLAVGVPAGMPVTDRHLARPGVASDLPDGTVAFPLPLQGGVAVDTGQRIDLLGMRPDGTGVRLSAAATVLGAEGDLVWVAVRRDETPALAAAGASSRLTAVVLPP